MLTPVVLIHAGACEATRSMRSHERRWNGALMRALGRARAVIEAGGAALDAAQAAVACMEDQADHLNAGRGSVLCADGSFEMSAALMRGEDRAAGAVAGLKRARYPSAAARLVLESGQVLMIGERADAWAAAAGAEQREPEYFVTDRERERLRRLLASLPAGTASGAAAGGAAAGGAAAGGAAAGGGGTVGAVCLDTHGVLAACTSTGGLRGQTPGRVGDTPIIGAGTWADRDVAVSCTGQGEAFIRVGVGRQIAALVAAGGELAQVAVRALQDVSAIGGSGGVIAIDARGSATAAFSTEVMPRGIWRGGFDPVVTIGPTAGEI
jgi:isoaspartyl peptidase/L-asparaginase-like protein (Ntn-hydrolase superfamily)